MRPTSDGAGAFFAKTFQQRERVDVEGRSRRRAVAVAALSRNEGGDGGDALGPSWCSTWLLSQLSSPKLLSLLLELPPPYTLGQNLFFSAAVFLVEGKHARCGMGKKL